MAELGATLSEGRRGQRAELGWSGGGASVSARGDDGWAELGDWRRAGTTVRGGASEEMADRWNPATGSTPRPGQPGERQGRDWDDI